MGGEFAVPATLTYRKLEAAKLHRPEYFATFLQMLTNDHSTLTYSRMGHEVRLSHDICSRLSREVNGGLQIRNPLITLSMCDTKYLK